MSMSRDSSQSSSVGGTSHTRQHVFNPTFKAMASEERNQIGTGDEVVTARSPRSTIYEPEHSPRKQENSPRKLDNPLPGKLESLSPRKIPKLNIFSS